MSTHCSQRCGVRHQRARRKGREYGKPITWTWSDFMRMAAAFDYCCAYCGTKPGRLDPDHVVPLSRGGANAITNLLPTCASCNSDKSALSLDVWAEARARRKMSAVATSWPADDRRYWHLTDVVLTDTVHAA
jgi:5-methylcytosine-specific restriction endonuclease McrA